jgi:predicted nucleic acid-binding protein
VILVDANQVLYAEISLNAHLAALAVEHNRVLHSTDADFSRFRGLKWRNPIAE